MTRPAAWVCFRPASPSLTSRPRSDSPIAISPRFTQQHSVHGPRSLHLPRRARDQARRDRIVTTSPKLIEASRPCRSSTSSSSASSALPLALRAGSSPRAASTSCKCRIWRYELPCAHWTQLTSRLWRSSSLLTIVCCYLMWSVTYLAQLHPLVGKYFAAATAFQIANLQPPNAEISDTPTARHTTFEPDEPALDQPNRRPYVYCIFEGYRLGIAVDGTLGGRDKSADGIRMTPKDRRSG